MTTVTYDLIQKSIQAVIEDYNGSAKDDLFYAVQLIKKNNAFSYSVKECLSNINTSFANDSNKEVIVQCIAKLAICLEKEEYKEIICEET